MGLKKVEFPTPTPHYDEQLPTRSAKGLEIKQVPSADGKAAGGTLVAAPPLLPPLKTAKSAEKPASAKPAAKAAPAAKKAVGVHGHPAPKGGNKFDHYRGC